MNEHVLVWFRKRPTGEVASIDKSLLLPSPSNIALRCDLNLSFLSLCISPPPAFSCGSFRIIKSEHSLI